jgi:hypothetical protein
MTSLRVYFGRKAVHDFGSSCDERDAVATFGEQAAEK